ncbi:hypothetical protein QQF64_014419 [Cirrhinus molitorella]|uniref:Uncharacterized protein n=1 Tax=Cirrhinus molitorella TaxID=172907 RepID=A0ABR3NSC3_9TELE
MESFDQGDEKPKSGAQAGRLLIWQNQDSKAHGGGGGSVSLSSDLRSRSQPDENADQSGWMKPQPLWGQVYGLNTLYTQTVERLLGMRPKVDCVGDLIKLTVHRLEAPFGANFLIDRGSIPPLPLSQLPSECGHRFLRTWRDFVFVIPYDGCYVTHEKDTFVLPLLWWGLPVKVSCSSLTSVSSAPTVSCYTNGMIVRMHRGASENLKIKVMNEWQPLLKVSARCGYSLVSHPEGVVIHAPYMPCTEPKIRDSVPVMNPQLYFPPNGESVVPIFRDPKFFDTHWVPAVQSNKDALLSRSQVDGYLRHPSTVD